MHMAGLTLIGLALCLLLLSLSSANGHDRL
jgi:hypothetical protein